MTLYRLPADLILTILEQWLSYYPLDLIALEKASINQTYFPILLQVWKMVKFTQFYDDYGCDMIMSDVSSRRHVLKWISHRGIHVEAVVMHISTLADMQSVEWGKPLASVTTLRMVSDPQEEMTCQRDLVALFDHLPNLTTLDLSQLSDVYDYTFINLFCSIHRQTHIQHLDVSGCVSLDMHSVSMFATLHRDSLHTLHMDGVVFVHGTLLEILCVCTHITTLSINAIALLPHQFEELAIANPRIENFRLYFGGSGEYEGGDGDGDG
ncbi:hypothetical protein EON65_30615, partial [archaeon]